MQRERRIRAYRWFVRKPKERRPLGRTRSRWADNAKTNLADIGWRGVDWIGLAQDKDNWRAIANAVMNILVP
jgi:hypothetical protein